MSYAQRWPFCFRLNVLKCLKKQWRCGGGDGRGESNYLLEYLCPPGPWFNIKMLSYQYRKTHCGDKTIVSSSYLHNGISFTGQKRSLYWTRAQIMFSIRNVLNDVGGLIANKQLPKL